MNASAKLAGVMGWPVMHSLSPYMHRYWLSHYRINGSYLFLPVRPGDLEEMFPAFPELGLKGWNITVPHKEASFKLVDQLDEAARSIGAVNTVVVKADGSLTGSNTDAYGFAENLKAQAGDSPSYKEKAVILGAGGAARAVIFALQQMGVKKILLINRTLPRAEAVAQGMKNVVPKPWESLNKEMEDTSLLVNTTTLGMKGQPPLELEVKHLPKEAVVADIVYAPLMTDLLKNAEARGLRIVTGLGMLMHQAVPGFSAWFGVTPEVTPALEKHLLACLSSA